MADQTLIEVSLGGPIQDGDFFYSAQSGVDARQPASALLAYILAGVAFPVVSVFGRTGAVTPSSGDYNVSEITGAAPLASPTFSGTPATPTASPGTNTTQIATTAFVTAAVAGGVSVSSVFGRTGGITAQTGDYTVSQVTGAAPLASPILTGTPSAPTASPGTNTTQIASTAFVTTAVAAAVTGVLTFRGSTDCSGNPNYPAAVKGDAYIVTVAGKVGGASGVLVGVGDIYFALANNAGGTQAAVGASWDVLPHTLAGTLLAANNLSDVSNATTARSNLGVPAGSGASTGTNTGDQTITLTGDVTGGGTGSFSTTLANSGVTAGTYNGASPTFQVNVKGQLVVAKNAAINTVYASKTCHLDSNLQTGGGTDDTALIQAALTAAAGGEFIQDGVSLISGTLVNGTTHTAALMIPPNTKLTFLPGCGWFLGNNSNCVILSNTGITGVVGGTPDANIKIEAHGVAINGNTNGQAKFEQNVGTNLFTTGLWFGNVQNLVIEGLTVQDAKTYCFFISNAKTVRLNHCRNLQSAQVSGANTDGLHLWGPVDDLETDSFWNNGTDDTLALNTNEGVSQYQSASPGQYFGQFRIPQTGNGSITNCTFRRTFFDGAWSGFRAFGVPGFGSPMIDNIRVIESRGSIGNAAWIASAQRVGEGLQIGLLQFSDWKVAEVNTNNGIQIDTLDGSLQTQLLRLDGIDPATTVAYDATKVLAVTGDYFATNRSNFLLFQEFYYSFNRLLKDSTPNAYTLTNHAGVTQAPGISGQAASFVAASNQYLSNSIADLTGGVPQTIAAWINFSGLTNAAVIFDNRISSSPGRGMALYVDTGGHLNFLIASTGSGAGQTVTGSSAVLTDANWHHVAVVVTSTTAILYVDGVADTSLTTLSPAYTGVATTGIKIGISVDLTLPANGAIDEIGSWAYAFTADQIAELASGAVWPFAGFN